MDFITATGSTGLGYRFQIAFSPRMPVNVFNNLPICDEHSGTGMDFLENCLSPDHIQTLYNQTVEKKLVEHIFGPILVRSRFTHKTNPVQSGDVANQFDFVTLK